MNYIVGSGTQTCLPIIETLGNDLSAYVATNVILTPLTLSAVARTVLSVVLSRIDPSNIAYQAPIFNPILEL